MNIHFDSQILLDNQKTGISITAENIINSISIRHKSNSYTLNFFAPFNGSKNRTSIDNLINKGCIPNECKWFNQKVYKLIFNFIPIPYSLFFGEDADITHFMNYYVPPGVKGRVVTMVYDMVFKAYPETVSRKTLYMLNLSMERSCRRSDAIITISEFSKTEIVKYLGVPPEKIFVMPCGVDFKKFRSDYNITEVSKVKSKYGIKEDYFLYLGTLEPRKNLERLIEAYFLLKKRIGSIPKLVISGKKGWMYDTIFERVRELRLGNDIIFTGYVDETDAPLLMNGAVAFLFPSLYEGFGLPLLEAMACGTPVITSNTASMPEVVGDAAILIDPYSVESITQAMERLLLDQGLQSQLVTKGFKRSSRFTWDRASDIVSDVYDKLMACTP